MIFLIFASVFGLLWPIAEGLDKRPSFDRECQAWKNATYMLEHLNPLNVSCSINSSCAGIECNGEVNYGVILKGFRFVLSYSPCLDPIEVEVVFQLPGQTHNANLSLHLAKNASVKRTIPVTGASGDFGLFSLETTLTVIVVSSMSDSGTPIITIAMNATVKIANSAKEFVLVPPITVLYPVCSSSAPVVTEPNNTTLYSTPSKLTASNAKSSLSGSPASVSSGSVVTHPATKVGTSPMIHPNDSTTTAASVSVSSSSQSNASTVPQTNPAGGPNKDVWLIVVITLIVAIVVAGILALVVNRVRRYRQQNRLYTLHVNSADDSELDDPPMLTA